MKRTLVLAVDRDDDFGVKGCVSTPVIGVENCLAAANSLGIADPEDSDLNALYAAISTCLDLQEEGVDANVALICGDEKVGHKSDLALVSQLEKVLDHFNPDNVVLVGDGAEDEYIYPIISSRSHVDSVRKVYVKQAPNIESSFYILTKMLNEPTKRRRFIAPLGAIIFLVALCMLIPDLVMILMYNDVTMLPATTRDFVLLLVGLILLMYAYSFGNMIERYRAWFKDRILGRSTRMVMSALAFGILFVSAIVSYYEAADTYYPNFMVAVVSYISLMIWPVVFAILTYIMGIILDEVQEASTIRLSNLFDCFSIGSFGLMVLGIIDLVLYYVAPGKDGVIGIIEILLGIMISFLANYIKKFYRSSNPVTE